MYSSSNTRPRALSQPRPSYRVSVYETPPSSSPESSRPSSSSGLPSTTGNRARSNSARSEKGSSSGGLFSSLRKKGKWDALDDDRHATHAEEDEDDHQVKNGRQRGDEYSLEGGAVSPGMGARSRSAGATSTLSAVLAGGNGASGSSLPPPAGVGMVRRNTAPLSPVDPNEKVVKALFAFTGSAADELDLLVGDGQSFLSSLERPPTRLTLSSLSSPQSSSLLARFRTTGTRAATTKLEKKVSSPRPTPKLSNDRLLPSPLLCPAPSDQLSLPLPPPPSLVRARRTACNLPHRADCDRTRLTHRSTDRPTLTVDHRPSTGSLPRRSGIWTRTRTQRTTRRV